MENKIIAALDIGTTKICVIIARCKEDGALEIKGIGLQPSYGLSKGVIVNIDATVNSIKKAVEEAELMAGVEVKELFVGIAGGQVKGINSRGVIAIGGRSDQAEISRDDIARVINTAQSVSIEPDKEIIHVIPQEFIVDNQDGIMDPLGMCGVRLEVEAHMVTCLKSATANIRKAVNRAGYETADIILQPIASAEAILNSDEKELGAIVIDIGGGTTDVVMYIGNSIWFTHVIPLGGNNVTKDISFGLRAPTNSAEIIKKQSGVADESIVDEEDYTSIPRVGGREPIKVSRKTLARIIEPRMAEIFSLAREVLQKTNYMERIHAGIILTGGASLCEGTTELAEKIFDQPVRIGSPVNVSGLKEKVDSPAYATAIGLIRFGANNAEEYRPSVSGSSENIFEKIKLFFREWFN